MDIMETIRSRYSEVSSVQKRIADYCLEHPDKASFQTLREFAQTTHTTDATVLKFCSNMGYHGFLAFRRQLQEYVRMRLSPNEKVRMSLARSTDVNDTCRKIIDGEKRGLDMTFQYLDAESFMQIVYRMNHARRIFVAGHHLTRIVAEFFLYQLKRIGREAHLVDTSDKKQTCDQARARHKGGCLCPHQYPLIRRADHPTGTASAAGRDHMHLHHRQLDLSGGAGV